MKAREIEADVAIIGGGLGGCAAALAALRNGRTVVMTEPTDWIGGQLTQQAVPPDEHPWIEKFGGQCLLFRRFAAAFATITDITTPSPPRPRPRPTSTPATAASRSSAMSRGLRSLF